MPIPDKDLMTRLTELVEEHGHQWKKIAPIIAAEGYCDHRGEPYSDNYLRKRMKKQELESGKCSDAPEAVKLSESSARDIRDLARAVVSILIQERLLETAIRDVLLGLECTTPGQHYEMPPQPERITDRRWEKLAGTCDRQLVKLFHEERRKLRLSVSQMLDYVLWNFFDKPRLSFEPTRFEASQDQGEQS
jgi:hypothetical protein